MHLLVDNCQDFKYLVKIGTCNFRFAMSAFFEIKTAGRYKQDCQPEQVKNLETSEYNLTTFECSFCTVV